MNVAVLDHGNAYNAHLQTVTHMRGMSSAEAPRVTLANLIADGEQARLRITLSASPH